MYCVSGVQRCTRMAEGSGAMAPCLVMPVGGPVGNAATPPQAMGPMMAGDPRGAMGHGSPRRRAPGPMGPQRGPVGNAAPPQAMGQMNPRRPVSVGPRGMMPPPISLQEMEAFAFMTRSIMRLNLGQNDAVRPQLLGAMQELHKLMSGDYGAERKRFAEDFSDRLSNAVNDKLTNGVLMPVASGFMGRASEAITRAIVDKTERFVDTYGRKRLAHKGSGREKPGVDRMIARGEEEAGLAHEDEPMRAVMGASGDDKTVLGRLKDAISSLMPKKPPAEEAEKSIKGNTEDFYKALAERESSNIPETQNKHGYIGLYQFGEMALIDIGYYKKDRKHYNNDWTGTWTGKDGINSLDDFKKNPKIQTEAIKEYHKMIWHGSLKRYHHYVGKEISGINITKSGMIAASHLIGARDLKTFIDSNGKIIPRDGNKIECTQYLRIFGGYRIEFKNQGPNKL